MNSVGTRGCKVCGGQHQAEVIEIGVCPKYSYHDECGWPTMPNSYRTEHVQQERINNEWYQTFRRKFAFFYHEVPETDWHTEYLNAPYK